MSFSQSIYIQESDSLGREWVNLKNTYPVGPSQIIPEDGLIDVSAFCPSETLGLLIESNKSHVICIIYKESFENSFFKQVIKPGERNWVFFPGTKSWKVRVSMLGEYRDARYEVWN